MNEQRSGRRPKFLTLLETLVTVFGVFLFLAFLLPPAVLYYRPFLVAAQYPGDGGGGVTTDDGGGGGGWIDVGGGPGGEREVPPGTSPTTTPEPARLPRPAPSLAVTATPRPTPVPVIAVAPPVARTAETVAPAAVAVAVTSAAVTTASAAAAAPGGLIGLLQAFIPFFSARRRRPPIGRVVEAGTNLPIPGVVVTILDEAGKPRESVKSRGDGTFAALLPKGTYQFVAERSGYRFAPKPTVDLFPGERLYTGGAFTVTADDVVTPVVLALQPLGARRRRQNPAGLALRRFLERLRVLQARLAIPILILGAAANSFALLVAPSRLLIGFEILYVVLLSMELLLSQRLRRAVGRIRDAVKRTPVALAIVRLSDAQTQRLVATKVTSPQGTFLLMPPPGRYRLHVVHAAYQPYADDHFQVTRSPAGALTVTVELQPRQRAPSAPRSLDRG